MKAPEVCPECHETRVINHKCATCGHSTTETEAISRNDLVL